MRREGSEKFKGYFPAVVTPFDSAGAIDEAAFRRNIQLLINDGVHGIVVCGTTGEYWSLTREERMLLFTLAAEEAAGAITVVGGATSTSVETVIHLANHAASAGLDGVMVAPPPGALPGRRELLHHFAAVNAAVNIDLMIYNFMERYGVDIPPPLMSELADLEHVVAVKESCSNFNQLTETLRLCSDRISIMAGWPALRGLASIALGCDGMIGSIEAQVMGAEARQLWDLGTAGHMDEARQIQMRFVQLHWTVSAAVGSAPAPVKAAMNLIGRPGGLPRLPILPLTDDEERTVATALVDLGLAVREADLASAQA